MDFDTFEYSQAQKSILKYVKTQFKGVRVRPMGNNMIEVSDNTGGVLNLSMNIYCDVCDIDTGKIIAFSDLPHDLDKLKPGALPKNWENNPAYFG